MKPRRRPPHFRGCNFLPHYFRLQRRPPATLGNKPLPNHPHQRPPHNRQLMRMMMRIHIVRLPPHQPLIHPRLRFRKSPPHRLLLIQPPAKRAQTTTSHSYEKFPSRSTNPEARCRHQRLMPRTASTPTCNPTSRFGAFSQAVESTPGHDPPSPPSNSSPSPARSRCDSMIPRLVSHPQYRNHRQSPLSTVPCRPCPLWIGPGPV